MLSELSLSSLASHDEFFISYQHAEISFAKMESYFLKEQLTDVVLIAGNHRIFFFLLCNCFHYYLMFLTSTILI